ncbi:MAG: hypothetical protein OEQ13_03660 [Acidobacteriota bacterium]|nr:hypothetical protein [Acidobacteriota bacterium]
MSEIGVVIPAAWSDKGTVTAVVLETIHDREIPIASDEGSGRELLLLLRRRVSVRGRLRADGALVVESYEEVAPAGANTPEHGPRD